MIRLFMILISIIPIQSSNKRLLTIYTRSVDNALYKQQLQLLKGDERGVTDRDLIMITYIYNSATAAEFKKYRVKGDFTVTLTGKDGGEKLRETEPVTLKKLFAIIDAMPMRKAEIKH